MLGVKHDTEKREENRQTQSGSKHCKKSSVLRHCLKNVNDVDEVTLDGRPFHTREAATGNARSPTFGGMEHPRYTTSVDVDALCSFVYKPHYPHINQVMAVKTRGASKLCNTCIDCRVLMAHSFTCTVLLLPRLLFRRSRR